MIDTHVHFFDLQHPELRYNWLKPDYLHPILGNIDPIKTLRYDCDAWWAEARFAGVTGVVHIQAAIGSADPVAETRWLQQMSTAAPVPLAAVGHVDLDRADVDHILEQHQQYPIFVGVRDFATEDYLAANTLAPRFEASLANMATSELVLDLDCEWPHFPQALALARRHPELSIVLEHLGYPRRRDDPYFQAWAAALDSLANAPNITVKISGVGMTDPRGDATSFARWIDHCLHTFTPSRCVLGSNWPLDRLVSSYDYIAHVYRQALTELSTDEQNQVLTQNAATLYRLAT